MSLKHRASGWHPFTDGLELAPASVWSVTGAITASTLAPSHRIEAAFKPVKLWVFMESWQVL